MYIPKGWFSTKKTDKIKSICLLYIADIEMVIWLFYFGNCFPNWKFQLIFFLFGNINMNGMLIIPN